MNKYVFIILAIFGISVNISAQPDLDIEPRRVEFEDVFSRYDYTLLINKGDQVLRIDSISLSKSFYLLDFENSQQLPIFLNPDEAVRLNIILSNFYNITVTDTTDTVWVYSNDPESPRDLRIRIDFFDDDYGDCSGTVTDEQLNGLPDSKLYFLYYGTYLFDSTFTDAAGNYSILLPRGEYTIAAEKEGYRTMFSGNTPDPYFAQPITLDSAQIANVDMILPPVSNTGFSVSGVVIDSVYGEAINKGVVVIRKGTHVPTLNKQKEPHADSLVYSGLVRSDGSFNITVEDSTYYFVQGYSDYYLPTYFNTQNSASVFWQNADSIYINQVVPDKNLYLKRDSSFGGGGAYGNIVLPEQGYDGITVLARSIENNELYSYNFGKEDGRFAINNLPYGSYQLIAQKIGFQNAHSSIFTISPQNQAQYNLNIQFILTDVEQENLIPEDIVLYPNYPNPFNPITTIGFQLPERSKVTIKIYNLLGTLEAVLYEGEKPSGYHEVKWDAENMPSGIYFYRLQTDNFYQTKKMILLK
jgi:hypothetical protein